MLINDRPILVRRLLTEACRLKRRLEVEVGQQIKKGASIGLGAVQVLDSF